MFLSELVVDVNGQTAGIAVLPLKYYIAIYEGLYHIASFNGSGKLYLPPHAPEGLILC